MHMKMAFSATEVTQFVYFESILKHAFAENDDFTSLPKEELLERLKAGSREATAILEESKRGGEDQKASGGRS